MDEPFQGVDIQTERKIISVLKNLQKKNKTIIVVHHDLTTIKKYFDYVVFLNIQKIASGPISYVFNNKNIQKTYSNQLIIK